jgi:hypothetical protein
MIVVAACHHRYSQEPISLSRVYVTGRSADAHSKYLRTGTLCMKSGGLDSSTLVL